MIKIYIGKTLITMVDKDEYEMSLPMDTFPRARVIKIVKDNVEIAKFRRVLFGPCDCHSIEVRERGPAKYLYSGCTYVMKTEA